MAQDSSCSSNVAQRHQKFGRPCYIGTSAVEEKNRERACGGRNYTLKKEVMEGLTDKKDLKRERK